MSILTFKTQIFIPTTTITTMFKLTPVFRTTALIRKKSNQKNSTHYQRVTKRQIHTKRKKSRTRTTISSFLLKALAHETTPKPPKNTPTSSSQSKNPPSGNPSPLETPSNPATPTSAIHKPTAKHPANLSEPMNWPSIPMHWRNVLFSRNRCLPRSWCSSWSCIRLMFRWLIRLRRGTFRIVISASTCVSLIMRRFPSWFRIPLLYQIKELLSLFFLRCYHQNLLNWAPVCCQQQWSTCFSTTLAKISFARSWGLSLWEKSKRTSRRTSLKRWKMSKGRSRTSWFSRWPILRVNP